MNKIRFVLLTLCVFLVVGCIATQKYTGNNFPSIDSPTFPSCPPVSKISDGKIVKLSEAIGKSKMFTNFSITKGGQNVNLNSDIDWSWDVNLKDGRIFNNHIMEMVTSVNNEKKNLKIQIQGIHETNGKEIQMDFLLDKKELNLPEEEASKFKKQMSTYVNNQFASLGKTIKTGDVLKYLPNELSKFKSTPGPIIKEEFPEIVKGLGIYKNKSVVVTEFIIEDKINNPELVVEARGKGYNLYDDETFIQLFGEGIMYLSFFTPKEGTTYFKIHFGYETIDVKVKNIINSLNAQGNVVEKEANKSSWNEASEKIKSLGALFEKGLITKEDFETKKRELLKNF